MPVSLPAGSSGSGLIHTSTYIYYSIENVKNQPCFHKNRRSASVFRLLRNMYNTGFVDFEFPPAYNIDSVKQFRPKYEMRCFHEKVV